MTTLAATSVGSTPTLTSTGVGSGLNVNSIVTQLVAAERAPDDARIAAQQKQITTKLSALATLQSAFSAFGSALDPLASTTAFQTNATTSGDTTVFTASATSAATAGSYNVQVGQLATAEQLASSPFASGSTAVVGTGTLALTAGSSTVNVTIDSSNSTLAGIRDAINTAAATLGLQATIVQTVGGARLLLSSSHTGAANTIKVTSSGGDGGLSQLTYDPSGTKNLTQLSAPQDATLTIDGLAVTSASNSVTGAIDGVTLTLVSAKPGVNVPLNVSLDTTSASSAVQNFVKQYNALEQTIANLRSYDPTTQVAGPLLGDATLLNVSSQLSRGVYNTVPGLSGNYTSLASIGVTTNADGTLALDQSKLSAALTADPTSVGKIFGSANGVAARLSTYVTQEADSTSDIGARTTSLNNSQKNLQTQTTALDARMAIIQARYQAQFSALDTLLSQMQQTSTFLTQQFAASSGVAASTASLGSGLSVPKIA
jgi:flagellar hook-associated protein 2